VSLEAHGRHRRRCSSTIERDEIGRARARPADEVASAGNDDAVKCIAHRYSAGDISADDVALDDIVVRPFKLMPSVALFEMIFPGGTPGLVVTPPIK